MRPIQSQLTIRENFRSYGSLFVRSIKASFAYRASTLTSIVAVTFIYAVPVLVWMHVYDQSSTPMKIPRAQMFPYLLRLAASTTGSP